MYKVLAFTLFLAGCSSTTKPVTYSDVVNYNTSTTYSKHCFSIWDNTHRGYVERKICGNHIP